MNSQPKTCNLKPTTLPRILLVDMNSYFASVEQQANPFLRGKPVGVVASQYKTSCIIAASKEAKKLGIKTGTLVWKAQKIYPKIILLRQDPEKYREVSRRIAKIFYDYTDQVERYSIDEAFLDLSYFPPRIGGIKGGRNKANNLPPLTPPVPGREQPQSNPLLIATEIKRRIRKEVGEWLTCSVGVAQNKFMAKLASSLEKPDGLTVVWRENLPEIYKNLDLTDLWGISYGWKKRLARLGVFTPLQLCNYPLSNLISLFGKPGYWLWQRVNGLEKDEVLVEQNLSSPQGRRTNFALRPSEDEVRARGESAKSFGHSWVLNFRTTDKERLKPVILRLAEKAARRMRKEGLQACGIYISIRMVDGSHFTKSKKLKYAINTGLEFYEEALSVLDRYAFNGVATRTRLPRQGEFGGQADKRLAPSDPATLNLPARQSLDGGGIQGLKEGDPDFCQDCEKDAQRRRKTIRVAPTNNNQRFPTDVMHIAVGFNNLVKYSGQLELSFDVKTFKRSNLQTALDLINNKYGEFTIQSGLLSYTHKFAPDAIAFGK
ncbi:MAG: DNA polymerase IV [bacterium]|nr:DNA polymerase IV [bacterium]